MPTNIATLPWGQSGLWKGSCHLGKVQQWAKRVVLFFDTTLFGIPKLNNFCHPRKGSCHPGKVQQWAKRVVGDGGGGACISSQVQTTISRSSQWAFYFRRYEMQGKGALKIERFGTLSLTTFCAFAFSLIFHMWLLKKGDEKQSFVFYLHLFVCLFVAKLTKGNSSKREFSSISSSKLSSRPFLFVYLFVCLCVDEWHSQLFVFVCICLFVCLNWPQAAAPSANSPISAPPSSPPVLFFVYICLFVCC